MTALSALFGLPHCRETDVYSAAEGRKQKEAAQLPEQTSDSNVITEWMDKVSVLSIGAYGLGSREELVRSGKCVREEKSVIEWITEWEGAI